MNLSHVSLGCLVLLLCSAGCGNRREKEPDRPPVREVDLLPAGAQRISNVQEALDRAIADSKSAVEFLSFNGQWIGHDFDAAIEFQPVKAVVLTRYGEAMESFPGTY